MTTFSYIPNHRPHLNRVNRDGGPLIEAKKILLSLTEYFDIGIPALIDKSRKRTIVYPRQLAMYLLGHYSGMTMSSIGVIFGKDHSTVVHSIATIDDLSQVDNLVAQQIKDIVVKLNAAKANVVRNDVGISKMLAMVVNH